MSQFVAQRMVLAASFAALLVTGCTMQPGAPLIPTPERQATVLPSEAPEKTPDGFANILADPATVAGLPRSQASIAREEASLRSEAARTEAAGRRVSTTSSVASLQARGRDHVAETRAAIEAGARPQDDNAASPPPLVPQPVPVVATAPTPAPAVPIDPDETAPRAVGVPPYDATGVAPAR